MFLLYTQQVVQADAIGIFLLALLAAPLVIPAIVKKSKISEAEEIKNRYPEGFKRVMGYRHSIDYRFAKEVVEKQLLIESAQREYEEKQRKAAEERRIREKASELRRECPFSSQGRTDAYLVHNEYSIRQNEKRHNELESRARKILRDNPLGAKEICGHISSFGSISEEDISKLIGNEFAIYNKQKECVANEAELKTLAPRLNELKRKYPLGVSNICIVNKWSTTNAEHVKLLLSVPETVAEEQEKGEKMVLGYPAAFNAMVKSTKELVAKGNRIGAENDLTRRYGERVAEKVMAIVRKEEEFKAFSEHLDAISKNQNDFAQVTRNMIPNILTDWGYYNYSFKMEYMDEDSNVKSNTLTVWQAFNNACCFDDTISYEYYPHYNKNRVFKTQLEGKSIYGKEPWEKAMSFILEVKKKYGDELFVILANTDDLNESAFQNNFGYIEERLRISGIQYGVSILTEDHENADKKYIIIDLITQNDDLKQYCESLFHYRHILQRSSNSGNTGVVFLTMLKCYDGSEVEALNKKIIKEKEDAIRRAKAEEEQKKQNEKDISEAKSLALSSPIGFKRFFPDYTISSIEPFEARQILQKKSAIIDYESTLSRLKNSVSGWDTVRGVSHYFFYYYYPTRFTDISADSHDARRLVFNFKNGVSHGKVKDLVISKIRGTFSSSDISKMCFACIPASTKSAHQSRYESFSHDVCQDLGMANAYDHITITKEKSPKCKGGKDSAEYAYDKSFFAGKFVVLFDDIVTKGDSVSSMKTDLEKLGAVVVCAISIGRTFSDWNGNTPKPHPYTGRI